MSHPLEGVTRLVYVETASAGAGATSANLRPPAGMTWELLWAYAMQNDGAVPWGWYWTDPDITNQQVVGGTAAGAYEKVGFPSMVGVTENPISAAPLILTYNRYATYTFTASAGAKSSYIYAFVKEFRGVALES